MGRPKLVLGLKLLLPMGCMKLGEKIAFTWAPIHKKKIVIKNVIKIVIEIVMQNVMSIVRKGGHF